ncbi:MAG TPA: hypothetical protein VMZ03_12250 [Chitinophagaceae bacterium]|nr:hypothetical protein [Chitinophagaceae bacterium]
MLMFLNRVEQFKLILLQQAPLLLSSVLIERRVQCTQFIYSRNWSGMVHSILPLR